MSSRSLIWRRIGIGAVALATVAAGSPLLLSAAANAAHTADRLTIAQENGRTSAAAGTCTAFTATPTTAQGGPTDAATITVTITESPASSDHDVDFCLIDGLASTSGDDGSPFFVNPPNYNAGAREYNAGESLTNPDNVSSTEHGEGATSNQPDSASATSPTAGNPSGSDSATFITDSRGFVRFGVVGLLSGAAATVNAFVDKDANGSRGVDPTTGGPEDKVAAAQVTIRFTAGGPPALDAVSDAVRAVQLTPEESFAALGQVHEFRALLTNQAGDVVGGVNQTRIIATAGPSTSTSFQGTCDQSDNETGVSLCRYTAPQQGTDTVTAFVNQTTGTPTFGLDATEPRDTATAVTTKAATSTATAARFLVLTPESAAIPAGGSQQFVATVTDANGAPVNTVDVRFTETGPGSFTDPATNSSATSTVVIKTAGAGRAPITFSTSSTDIGSTTINATIATAGTQCGAAASGSTPAGQCSDSSPVTITAAPSPSPSPSPSPTTSPTASPTPTASPPTSAGSRYRGLASPVRVLDTRKDSSTRRAGEIVLDLSSQIPDTNATSAVLNVTVTNPTHRGFLVAYPTGTSKPGTSNVNFEPNQTQANEVVVRLSSSRKVSLFVDSAAAHVIADLVGSFTTSASGTGRITTNAPVRAFDSRTTASPTRTREVVIDLSDHLPGGSTDAILNVTVTRTSARGFVTVYPTGSTRPGTSNVNFERGQTQANEVITRVGSGDNVSFFIDSAFASLIVDVVGAVGAGTQSFTALSSPQRALDTRDNRGSRRSGNVEATMPSSVPADATGVILNVTATNGTRPGFVTVFRSGTQNPETSNVNFREESAATATRPASAGTQANEVTTGLGANGRVTLFIGGGGSPEAHVIVDVVGYLSS